MPTEFFISIFAEFLHIFCTTKNLNLGIQDPNFSFKWLVVVYRIIFYPRLLQFLLLECQKFQCFVGGHIVPPPRLSRNSEMLGLIGLKQLYSSLPRQGQAKADHLKTKALLRFLVKRVTVRFNINRSII